MKKLVIAARDSLLSRAQVELVRGLLEETGIQTDFLPTKTKGDHDKERALREIGGDGLFVREVEKELLSGQADAAVHCGKDLPYRIADGLVIAGVPKAAEAADCLVFPAGKTMTELAVIGTGSARREQELKKILPDIVCREIRGNINTRLEKLRSGQYDGIVLAKAGLDRLRPDLTGLTVHEFSPDEMIPAACQGILAIECRADDTETIELLSRISDADAMRRFQAERDLFCRMEADCATALGVHAVFAGEQLTLRAMFGGRQVAVTGDAADQEKLIRQIVEDIYTGGKK